VLRPPELRVVATTVDNASLAAPFVRDAKLRPAGSIVAEPVPNELRVGARVAREPRIVAFDDPHEVVLEGEDTGSRGQQRVVPAAVLGLQVTCTS